MPIASAAVFACDDRASVVNLPKERLLEKLWGSDPAVLSLLKTSGTLEGARESLFGHFNELERHLYNIHSDRKLKHVHHLEKNNAKECIRVLKNIIRTENERLVGCSALKHLFCMAKQKRGDYLSVVTEGFLCELIFLLKGANGNSGIYSAKSVPAYLKTEGKKSALMRSRFLDLYALDMERHFRRYRTGLDPKIIAERAKVKKRILGYFGAAPPDWRDYSWHIGHIISDAGTLSSIVELDGGEAEGLRLAEQNNIPVQITPYYLSLFDEKKRPGGRDEAIRAQVIPSANYCKAVAKESCADFMNESSTSPIGRITRRYPRILILKPYDSCPQICVYCQRNWEIKRIGDATLSRREIERALGWIRDNKFISEVLITGGDPLTLGDGYLDWLMSRLSRIRHVKRVRIGTRFFVTIPFRITDNLVKIVGKYHKLGCREVCFVTHFEHPMEMTPDSLEAIRKVRNAGMSVYNQQVFTYYNSRRYESCLLRKTLKLCGVDPYYTFNTKGKEETLDFRVPIARIEQERKEEARLLPGVERTDEPVFNVPRLGKSHLRAGQEHEIIMILPDGRRVYRFYPWEAKISLVEPYNYVDVSIFDYLKRLAREGEGVSEYGSIWYYF